MIAAGEKLRQKPGYTYLEWIPCDSHGLNLLIQDIFKLSVCSVTLKSATDWVTHFKKSSKQYHILRGCQRKEYGRHRALIKAAITRWGTQVSGSSLYSRLLWLILL